MSDLRLIKTESGYDIGIRDNDIEVDDTLKTAVIVSLFTDRRVSAEELPPEDSDRAGWWADAVEDDFIGSKLWLLRREKITSQLLVRAREYCEEALRWLIEDGIASRVAVATARTGTYSIGIGIEIEKPDGVSSRYDFLWRNS